MLALQKVFSNSFYFLMWSTLELELPNFTTYVTLNQHSCKREKLTAVLCLCWFINMIVNGYFFGLS